MPPRTEPADRTPSADPAVWPVLIIGSGFSGLGMAVQLDRSGIGPWVMLERDSEIGGTWRDNTYPGCACDIPSPLYSFSFAPNPNWSRLYAHHDEIQRYLLEVVDTHRLRPHVRLGREVVCARYDDDVRLWTVTTANGETYRARVVVSGMGPLSVPARPNVPGLDAFEGRQFHSATWDHDADLSGKRVAVIGTGASAIQFVPHVAKQVAALTLFQRTAPWIIPSRDRRFGSRERALFSAVPWAQKALRGWIYARHELRALAFTGKRLQVLMKLGERTARTHLHDQVADPTLRAKLTPSFSLGCKRVLRSSTYYPALTQANVDVVTSPIERVDATGVVTSRGRHDVDVIIHGTGFKVQQQVAPGVIFGRDGVDLGEVWGERMAAYKGTAVAGFPNLFFLVGPNVSLGHNSMVYMIESQVAYIVDALQRMRAQGWATVEVDAEVQARFTADLDARLGQTIWASGCRSWYLDDRGRNTTLWPGFTFQFRKLTARFDAENYRIAGDAV